MLAYTAQGNPQQPALVFLHGLLGSAADWHQVCAELSRDYYCIALDLPWHGASAHIACAGLADCCVKIAATVQVIIGDKDYRLVGYSLGGRLACYLAARIKPAALKGMVLENSHLGLDEGLRAIRQRHDSVLAAQLASQPPRQFLASWYQQAVFAQLTAAQRERLISQRIRQWQQYSRSHRRYQQGLASMLRATSLSTQPQFHHTDFTLPVCYLCGSNDSKFTQIAKASGFDYQQINNAGHIIHFEQRQAFIDAITQWLTTQER